MLSRLSMWILKTLGWTIHADLPDIKKYVAIAAPHTSNWDFPLGILAAKAINLKVHWMGKHTLFWWPAGVFLRWLGGVPVNRRASQGVVAMTVVEYEQHDKFLLTILPTGSRARGVAWKTGFYHIAQGAEVPILPLMFDYGHRTMHFGPLFHLSDDMTADMNRLQSLFIGVQGKNT